MYIIGDIGNTRKICVIDKILKLKKNKYQNKKNK